MSSELKAQKKQLPEQPPPSPISSLPEEIFIDIIARVPRIHHQTLSQVSRRLRSLISSPELYARRSILKRAEQCIYVAVSKDNTSYIHWFTLCNMKRVSGTDDHRLVHISSLPPMPLHGSYVSFGSNIFAMSGFHVSLIDCRSHTAQPLADMPNAVAGAVAQVINGKVYVIGGARDMMVFDIKTKVWEVKTRQDWEKGKKWLTSVAFGGKIFMRTCYDSFVYDPRGDSLERDEVLHSREWFSSCVVEDVLYYYDACGKCLRGYDPKVRSWGVVRGLERLLPEGCLRAKTVSYGCGGRMVLFLQREESIWCAEIVVERRQGGEIWGDVVWCEVVLGGNFHIMDCVPAVLL
ncbi:unnamed protein product [Eruca vesicaria subsp. sativa]|uniref:F-box domain-containing protein n=1 Tax=Eruca vesicaria subsp. sativa TaxID=29727 RepID=A0ABC8L5A0_ERUVS|nr:unnamed protein product [Eruca vesicaria subsp. sativa]